MASFFGSYFACKTRDSLNETSFSRFLFQRFAFFPRRLHSACRQKYAWFETRPIRYWIFHWYLKSCICTLHNLFSKHDGNWRHIPCQLDIELRTKVSRLDTELIDLDLNLFLPLWADIHQYLLSLVVCQASFSRGSSQETCLRLQLRNSFFELMEFQNAYSHMPSRGAMKLNVCKNKTSNSCHGPWVSTVARAVIRQKCHVLLFLDRPGSTFNFGMFDSLPQM